MHIEIEPKIMYFGTPVVLISTLNEDDTPNLAPMSSAWWLKKSCLLGLGKRGKTFETESGRETTFIIRLPLKVSGFQSGMWNVSSGIFNLEPETLNLPGLRGVLVV